MNDSWRDPAKRNLEDLLTSLGFFEPELAEVVAQELRSTGRHEGPTLYTSIFFVGENLHEPNEALARLPHRTWSDVLRFVYRRFTKYGGLKTNTSQWDATATKLLELAGRHPEDEFVNAARDAFTLPAA
jgi:hypothetical protein